MEKSRLRRFLAFIHTPKTKKALQLTLKGFLSVGMTGQMSNQFIEDLKKISSFSIEFEAL